MAVFIFSCVSSDFCILLLSSCYKGVRRQSTDTSSLRKMHKYLEVALWNSWKTTSNIFLDPFPAFISVSCTLKLKPFNQITGVWSASANLEVEIRIPFSSSSSLSSFSIPFFLSPLSLPFPLTHRLFLLATCCAERGWLYWSSGLFLFESWYGFLEVPAAQSVITLGWFSGVFNSNVSSIEFAGFGLLSISCMGACIFWVPTRPVCVHLTLG